MLSGYEHVSRKHKGMCLDPQHPYKRLRIGMRVPVTQHGEVQHPYKRLGIELRVPITQYWEVRQADPESPGASQLT